VPDSQSYTKLQPIQNYTLQASWHAAGTAELLPSAGNEASVSFIGRKGPGGPPSPPPSVSSSIPQQSPAADVSSPYGVGVPTSVNFNGLACGPLVLGPAAGDLESRGGESIMIQAIPILQQKEQPKVSVLTCVAVCCEREASIIMDIIE